MNRWSSQGAREPPQPLAADAAQEDRLNGQQRAARNFGMPSGIGAGAPARRSARPANQTEGRYFPEADAAIP